MPSDTPRFPVLEAADGYRIRDVDAHVTALVEEMRRGRRTGFHPGPFDPRPFPAVHDAQVYDAGVVDAWMDQCSAELEARRQHPSNGGGWQAGEPYAGDLDDPPELRDTGVRDDSTPDHFVSSVPTWARVVALVVIVALLGAYVLSFF
ncbi:hypothetical protein [Nocardioides zeae]|uniref:DivIVA domain-containing protein n=1 Tax=Nocardioides zeae TaxID=1457234 RepID=A0AAJ1X040_9ACTN|nr:hypothetical protein [Nocardioides zeae]MDQ1102724.1 hypothetical protein [Nocardioides zeae]